MASSSAGGEGSVYVFLEALKGERAFAFGVRNYLGPY